MCLADSPPPSPLSRNAYAVAEDSVQDEPPEEADPEADGFLDRDAEDAPGEREDDERNCRELGCRRGHGHAKKEEARRSEQRGEVWGCR